MLDLEDEVLPDLKNAWGLALKVFTGDFFERHGFVDKQQESLTQAEMAKQFEAWRASQLHPQPAPATPMAPADVVAEERAVQDAWRAAKSVEAWGPQLLAVEVDPEPMTLSQAKAKIVDVPVASSCLTCGGTRKVGAPGFQIPCPLCASCKTCSGSGMVGRKGHEVACPLCCKK